MKTKNKKKISPLQIIPGVGASIANDLHLLGINKVEDLIGKDPEKMYHRSNKLCGAVQDICLLYVFRCAVYYASSKTHQKEKLNWWYWKNNKN